MYNIHNIRNIRNENDIHKLRKKIDKIDLEIMQDIYNRGKIVEQIWNIKHKENIPIYDEEREDIIFQKIRRESTKSGLNEEKIVDIYKKIVGQNLVKQ